MANTNAMRFRIMVASEHFEQSGSTHAAADAHGDHDELRTAAPAFHERVTGQSRAGHAIGMAERDGAAVHVEAVVGNPEPVAAIEHLHRESFVQLPEIDVCHFLADALQQLRNREYRTDAHL